VEGSGRDLTGGSITGFAWSGIKETSTKASVATFAAWGRFAAALTYSSLRMRACGSVAPVFIAKCSPFSTTLPQARDVFTNDPRASNTVR
jgi:hypothetical protein